LLLVFGCDFFHFKNSCFSSRPIRFWQKTKSKRYAYIIIWRLIALLFKGNVSRGSFESLSLCFFVHFIFHFLEIEINMQKKRKKTFKKTTESEHWIIKISPIILIYENMNLNLLNYSFCSSSSRETSLKRKWNYLFASFFSLLFLV
jgi:hypothetical protein